MVFISASFRDIDDAHNPDHVAHDGIALKSHDYAQLLVSIQSGTFYGVRPRVVFFAESVSILVPSAIQQDMLDLKAIGEYEHDLLMYATDKLSTIPGVRIIGTAKEKAAVLSFVIDGIHPHDIGTILDAEGIAIRTGHHCAQPVMLRFGVPATARASFAFYNTKDEVDALVKGIYRVKEILG